MNDKEIAKYLLANSILVRGPTQDQAQVIKAALRQFVADKPTVHLVHIDGDDGGGVVISKYKEGIDPEFENNHIVVADVSRYPKVDRGPHVLNILRNILTQCGVFVTYE